MTIPRREKRRHPRQPIDVQVALYWEEFGNTYCARGHGVDISSSGVCVEVANLYQVLPERKQIRFQIEALRLAGTATVRHSARRHGTMIIGLEFCGGLQWKPRGERNAGQRLMASCAG